MNELKQINETTFYLECPSRVGFYLLSPHDVILIDSGNDSDMGKKIKRILEEHEWQLSYIINTHSHADHTGGNQVLQKYYNCPIYASGIEAFVIQNPWFEPLYLYGGNPPSILHNKFLEAKPSRVADITQLSLPPQCEILPLKGHSFDMIGFKTKEDVYFLGDSLMSAETLDKYHINYLYDVKETLNTLAFLESLKGTFVLSHASITTDLKSLIQKNRDKIYEILQMIVTYLEKPHSEVEIVHFLVDHYQIHLNNNQWVLISSTIRSYLTYLLNERKIITIFVDNVLYYEQERGKKYE